MEWWEGTSFDAVSYGPLWNGWLTPVVNLETMRSLMAEHNRQNEAFGDAHGNGGTYHIAEAKQGRMSRPVFVVRVFEDEERHYGWVDYDVLVPTADGLYDLGGLGWTWVPVGESEA